MHRSERDELRDALESVQRAAAHDARDDANTFAVLEIELSNERRRREAAEEIIGTFEEK